MLSSLSLEQQQQKQRENGSAAVVQQRSPILARLERTLTAAMCTPSQHPSASSSPHSSSSASSVVSSTSPYSENEEEERMRARRSQEQQLDKLRPDEMMGVDARTRFSHTKALFEHLERITGGTPQSATGGARLPSFYSPRLQRSSSTGAGPGVAMGDGKPPPPVPPKPSTQHSHSAQVTPSASTHSFNTSTTGNSPSSITKGLAASPVESPLSQMERNFSQFASDVERIAAIEPTATGRKDGSTGTATTGHTVASYLEMKSEVEKAGKRLYRTIVETTNNDCINGGTQQQPSLSYDAYWRGPASYYTKRLFGTEQEEEQQQRGTTANKRHQRAAIVEEGRGGKGDGGHTSPSASIGGAPEQNGSESGESVPSEPRPSTPPPRHGEEEESIFELRRLPRDTENGIVRLSSQKVVRQDTYLNSSNGSSPAETMRGLSPERDPITGRKISFSTAPIRVYKTHGVDEYDRRNDEIDPVASCAEYELERRLERMELFEVELQKGPEGLGVSIIGMGVGADAGLEKLGIFVKSITTGGAVHRDGRIRVCDQIVSVDGTSLVGVSQLFAAQALRSTGSRVHFTIGRELNLDESEVAQLIRQSLEQDSLRERQRLDMIANQYPPSSAEPELDSSQSKEEKQRETGKKPEEGIAAINNPTLGEPKSPHADVTPNRNAAIVNNAQTPFPIRPSTNNKTTNNGTNNETPLSIRARVRVLETELEQSQQKASETNVELENTRAHYTQLENRYKQAMGIAKSFQEREREMLKREESHVELMKAKEQEYAELVSTLRGRIDELERRLNGMTRQRAHVVDGELSELRERLEQCEKSHNHNADEAKIEEQQKAPPQYGAGALSKQMVSRRQPPQKRNGGGFGEIVAHAQQQQQQSKIVGCSVKHAGLGSQSVPLSAAPPPPPHHQHYYQQGGDQQQQRFVIFGSSAHPNLVHHHRSHNQSPPFGLPEICEADCTMPPTDYPHLVHQQYTSGFITSCDSPIPRISEPASPALPQKFLQKGGGSGGARSLLFPLRKKFVPTEHEFWRENVEAQGLQVLQWSVDDVCQLLIHIGLDKYIPEFTINKVNGPKLLDLDGTKLKAIGLFNHSDRAVIKKRVKAIKQRIERERKALEKEARQRGGVKIVSVQ